MGIHIKTLSTNVCPQEEPLTILTCFYKTGSVIQKEMAKISVVQTLICSLPLRMHKTTIIPGHFVTIMMAVLVFLVIVVLLDTLAMSGILCVDGERRTLHSICTQAIINRRGDP